MSSGAELKNPIDIVKNNSQRFDSQNIYFIWN